MKKQTAANNDLLEKIKATFNQKIFKSASKIMNKEGKDACLNYIKIFTQSFAPYF